MESGATEREVWEKKLEKRLQDPKTEPLVSLPLYFLKDITRGFSTEQELGRGAYGVVYKGVLQSGKAIAVKKIRDEHLMGNQVENEIICFTEVSHRNVVQLVGYCVETKSEVMEHSGKRVMVEKRAFLLCFEFLCEGSLDKHLSDDTSVLDWDKRYKIIRGICIGLHYLHDECHIVHLDLKPQNILMDAVMLPKIADFGLSRLLGEQKSKTITKNLAGTLGYMAKEYIDKGIISSKADIFSLGVIMLEIITGRRDYPNISERTQSSNNISERTETSLKHFTKEVVGSWRNRLIEITPMHMSLEMCFQQVQHCIDIALKCLEPDSNKRPTSLDIVQSLNAIEPICTSPGNPPSVVEKDSRNHNIQSQVNMNIINIPKTISAIKDLNECANLFHWVISATSSLKSKCSGTQLEKLQGDVRELQSDLQCLSDTLPAMYNLIDRAKWRIHDHYVADLLSKLKDAVYGAEDLLDEFRWYEKKVSLEGNGILVEPIIDFFHSVTQGGFNKVTGIQRRLDRLSGHLEKIGLHQTMPRFDKSFRPETTAFPIDPEIFGRNEEKKKLIEMLGVHSTGTSERKRKRHGACSSASNQICATIDSTQATSVQVLPIVGIGGVGKTTLTQDICSNSKVKGHFDPIIWICVSDDFDVKRLTKEALHQSSPTGKVKKTDNLNLLQGDLAQNLGNKRFLIVLDDMWDGNELDWKRFCAPFRNALKGSMMLVTTRFSKVADVVRTMDPFPLEGLNKDPLWKFFKVCVFGSSSSNIDPKLEMIGEKILPKLRGSPLAAKTLGRLLGMSLDAAHWDRILKSQLWELQQTETDILPALRLSYMYLPFCLRRCFSFCAMYPKDYHFEKEDLIEIWAAEGFVQHQPNVSLRHTSGQYFEELAHLSLFQKHPWYQGKYIMHDLIHDMAQLVSKDECCVIKDTKDFQRIPQNVLHLWVLNGGDIKCSDLLNLCMHKKLRTLLCDLSLESEIGHTVMEKWCTELLCMRVMICSSISKLGLPDNISNLKHLRYLEILNACHWKRLPAAFCCLYNMQILYAKNWEIDDIPSGFGMLINLQKFESVKCQFHHRYIHSVNEGASATDEGQRWHFQIENYNGESLPSWSHPQNAEQIHCYGNTNCTFLSLTDVEIRDCRNLSSLEQFLQPTYMPMIKKIAISYCGSLESVPTERFGDFCFLEVLTVSQCPQIKLRHLFAPFLKALYLTNSGNLGGNIECSCLTILHLSNSPLDSIKLQNPLLLEDLEISSCPSPRVIIDSEPISSDILNGEARSKAIGNTCKSLNVVRIINCQFLSSLEQFLQPHCVPIIKKIEISHCPNLESVPTNRFGDLSFLELLSVSHCPKIKSEHLFAPSLKKLYLENSGNLGYKIDCSSLTILQLSYYPLECIELQMWNLPLLQDLFITSCFSLKIIRNSEPSTDHFHGEAQSRMGTFPLLADLTIISCEKLKTIDDLLYLPAAQTIWIKNCGLLSLAAYRLGSFSRLKDFKISACQSLNWQNGMLLPRSLQNLRLWSCGYFSDWFPNCLENLTSLKSLEIRDCECIVSVPGHLWSSNLRSLQSLMLLGCSKLKSIGGPGAIAHIKDLFIGDCSELKEIVQPMTKGSFVYMS